MGYSASEPLLVIDGVKVSLDNVWIHSQTDPFPGGHHYALFLPNPLAQEWLSELGLESSAPAARLSWDGLYWLSSLLVEKVPRLVLHPQFVLNTIERIAPEEHGLTLYGICSPFVRFGEGAKDEEDLHESTREIGA